MIFVKPINSLMKLWDDSARRNAGHARGKGVRQMKALLIVAGATLPLATPAAAQQLVTNGGFETGDFTGFTQSGNTELTGVLSGEAPSGDFSAFFGPTGSTGSISQTLATTTGGTYQISFDLQSSGGSPTFYEVLFGGVSLFSATNAADFDFTTFSTSAVASTASTALTFTFRNDPSFFNLDNISVTPIRRVTGAVPEPATWAMMLIGFGGMGVSLRRRRATTAKARTAISVR
jgi:PEP-CTERM motif